MGRLTAAVIVTFGALHVSVVITGLCLTDSRWIEGGTNSTETFTSETYMTPGEHDVKLGLFKVCIDDFCKSTENMTTPGEKIQKAHHPSKELPS